MKTPEYAFFAFVAIIGAIAAYRMITHNIQKAKQRKKVAKKQIAEIRARETRLRIQAEIKSGIVNEKTKLLIKAISLQMDSIKAFSPGSKRAHYCSQVAITTIDELLEEYDVETDTRSIIIKATISSLIFQLVRADLVLEDEYDAIKQRAIELIETIPDIVEETFSGFDDEADFSKISMVQQV